MAPADLLPIVFLLSAAAAAAFLYEWIEKHYFLTEIPCKKSKFQSKTVFLLTAALGSVPVLMADKLSQSACLAFICLNFAVLILIDMRYQLIPNRICILLAIAAASWLFVTNFDIHDSLAGMLAAGILMYFLSWLSHGGLGFGDVKLSMVLGLLLGLRSVFSALFVAFVLGACIAAYALATGRKSRNDTIAFGPFLVLGSWIILFLQNR